MERQEKKARPYRVQLPGFLIDKEIGLGEVIKRATASMGVKPCGECEKRAARLDGWLRFTKKP